MMTISEVIIDADEEIKEIENRIKLLVTTPKGSIPMDRNYGIDFGAVIDKPVAVAQNCFATEVINAVSQYETNVNVSSVECVPITESGFIAIIRLSRKEAS